MADRVETGRSRQSASFLALYALAVAGVSASYAPFLTLFLPTRLIELFGDRAVEIMSYNAFAGAIAASLSNIFFGWMSDRTGNRRGWCLAGLILSCVFLVGMRDVATVPQLLATVVLWQIALNMMLAPLAAWAGDCVPDEQKGLLGGLLSLAPGTGALVGAALTLPLVEGLETRLILNAGLVAAMVLPVLVWGRPVPMPQLLASSDNAPAQSGAHSIEEAKPLPAWRMWIARLLVQISEASLFAFLLLWLRGLDPAIGDNDVAKVFTIVLFAAVPIALFSGQWSDRARRPMVPLVFATAFAALGLAGMAIAPTRFWGVSGYLVFGIAASVFLALHSSQTLRVLPRAEHRGRDLGFFNLTNTVPSLVMPGIALALIPVFGFQALFAVLAALTCLAIPMLGLRLFGKARS